MFWHPATFASCNKALLASSKHSLHLTLYGHITTEQQRTIIRQYGDWFTGRWWVGCYIWYSEEWPGHAEVPSSPLLAVPNVTAHPSTASVPTSYYLMWHYNCLSILKGQQTTRNCTRMEVTRACLALCITTVFWLYTVSYNSCKLCNYAIMHSVACVWVRL